jgi:hypothetical protein
VTWMRCHNDVVAIQELARVMLRHDLPDHLLRAGDVGVVVGTYQGGRAYEVEFTSADGETIAVETLTPDQIEPLGGRRILNARTLAAG